MYRRTSTSAPFIRWAHSRIISRSKSGSVDARVSSNCAPVTGTMSPTATSLLLRCSEITSKDREVAVSLHGDTPYFGKRVTSGSTTPYTTSVDVNQPQQSTDCIGGPASALLGSIRAVVQRLIRVATACGG